MKRFPYLKVSTCCDHDAVCIDDPTFGDRPLTTKELRDMVDTYNAMVDLASGVNALPHQATASLLRTETLVAREYETMEPELDRHQAS